MNTQIKRLYIRSVYSVRYLTIKKDICADVKQLWQHKSELVGKNAQKDSPKFFLKVC